MTTVRFGYQLSAKWEAEHSISPADSISEEDLRYRLFLGDVTFEVGGCQLGTAWGWVPILDFVLGVRWIVAELKRVSSSMFEFTESEHSLRFERNAETVSVSATYAQCVGECRYSELDSSSLAFALEVANDFTRHSPEVARSEAFKKVVATIR